MDQQAFFGRITKQYAVLGDALELLSLPYRHAVVEATRLLLDGMIEDAAELDKTNVPALQRSGFKASNTAKKGSEALKELPELVSRIDKEIETVKQRLHEVALDLNELQREGSIFLVGPGDEFTRFVQNMKNTGL